MMVLRIPAFRRLLVGATLSQLGDVFFLVAIPWVVLDLSGSALAMSSILITVAIPRAGLMLFGGALSDRVSVRSILIVSNLTLMACVGVVAFLAQQHFLALWMLYIIALIFGIADAFAGPAMKVLVPSIVAQEEIPAANSLLQTSMQLCLLGGAGAAGLTIQRFGIASAMAIDTASFLFLIAALVSIHEARRVPFQARSVVAAIGDGIQFVLRDPSLRLLIIVIAVVNFAITGATQVGLVMLVHTRFGSAADYGSLVAATAIGSVLGYLLAGSIKVGDTLVSAILGAALLLGIALGTLSVAMPIWALFGVLLFCGIVAGFVNVQAISFLQAKVIPEMLGRVMSLVALASIGIAPLSLAIGGFIAQQNLSALFITSGALLVSIALVGWPVSKKALHFSSRNRLDVSGVDSNI
ncbi:MAG: MFS transporter [Vulcanimicrobiaceae bacterium]